MRLSFFAASAAAAVTSAARQCVECVCVAFCNTAPWRTVVFVSFVGDGRRKEQVGQEQKGRVECGVRGEGGQQQQSNCGRLLRVAACINKSWALSLKST